MKIRGVSLFFVFLTVFAFTSLLQAQTPGGASSNSLQAQVSALQTQVTALQTQVNTLQGSVSKLNGNISASDLAGTYAVYGIQNELTPPIPGVRPASVGAYVISGTATLNSDGTGTASTRQDGNYLVFGQSSLSSADGTDGPESLNWTYSNGALTVVNPGNSTDTVTFSVAAGGRVMVAALSNHTDGTALLLVLSRLR